ncbi:hypothetical protein CYLTODRAFT_421509 [Cylindrobasidium torrendii FP15055 ss-10]|uniref:Uncharacterized protein n=1 Tax=Cylindrobasidium torrendii FP15055 ss-10 TaxID=1314674 RepID=A0A0D7BDI5_9AGAR|nr:hypothetical protein CYLTODRAFT_421509 [Cylindrobasidium torrendii FP15055 ss-10]
MSSDSCCYTCCEILLGLCESFERAVCHSSKESPDAQPSSSLPAFREYDDYPEIPSVTGSPHSTSSDLSLDPRDNQDERRYYSPPPFIPPTPPMTMSGGEHAQGPFPSHFRSAIRSPLPHGYHAGAASPSTVNRSPPVDYPPTLPQPSFQDGFSMLPPMKVAKPGEKVNVKESYGERKGKSGSVTQTWTRETRMVQG